MLFTFSLFSFELLASSGNGDEGYPDPWEDYSGKCKYSNQTPINIVPNVEAELRDLRVIYRGVLSGLKHHGHTITLMVTAQNGVLANQDFYELEEAHLHTPSENHVNGKNFSDGNTFCSQEPRWAQAYFVSDVSIWRGSHSCFTLHSR